VYKNTGSTSTRVIDFSEHFAYDGNGNIDTAVRYGTAAVKMDSLAYNYNKTNGRLQNNKLNYIHDAVGTHIWPYGLDNQAYGNYKYDAIGNMTADLRDTISGVSWTVYGKIQGLTNSAGTIAYSYDPSGQRVTKTVGGITTYYIRDAQGNTLALYDNKNSTVNWREQDLYGSSRLGMWQPNFALTTSTTTGLTAWDTTGRREYELSNHLGNVLVTISDKRLQHSTNGTTVDYFNADIATAQEYYAFGGLMQGRDYIYQSSYRYGFNGQERSDEISGSGNHNTAEFWEYDTRVGRRWNLDPIVKPDQSGYSAFANNPIWFADIDGQDTTISGKVRAQSAIVDAKSNPYFVPPGVKLESFAKITAKIKDGKFIDLTAVVDPKGFESPILGGIKPKFTEGKNFQVIISPDQKSAIIHYDVQTQLSNIEIMGQWIFGLTTGLVQNNIITVTQSVDIVFKIGSISTTFDGSTFPESRYTASYTVNTGKIVVTGNSSKILHQSTYSDAIHKKTFKETGNPQKGTKVLTY
jgi:YD repeat-containing protein